jgi:hypothetical protein
MVEVGSTVEVGGEENPAKAPHPTALNRKITIPASKRSDFAFPIWISPSERWWIIGVIYAAGLSSGRQSSESRRFICHPSRGIQIAQHEDGVEDASSIYWNSTLGELDCSNDQSGAALDRTDRRTTVFHRFSKKYSLFHSKNGFASVFS